MATRPKKTIASQLERANLAINNSLANDEIKALVAPRGYTVAKLNDLKTLYESAVSAVSGKVGGRGAQKAATGYVNEAHRVAHVAYQDLAKTARRAFKPDKAKLATLGLDNPEPDSVAGFLEAATTLFDNASLPDIQSGLQDFGYTPQFLASERAKIDAFDQSDRVQETAKGSSKGSTGNQNKLLADLNDKVTAYLDIAQIALRDRADLQAMIGLKPRRRRGSANGGDQPSAPPPNQVPPPPPN